MTEKQHDAAADLLIKEVDEDLRQEQMARMWRRHGPVLVGVAVAAVLAVVGWQGWRAWDSNRRQESSTRLHEVSVLLEQGKRDEAIGELTRLAADGASGYRLLAGFMLADLRQQQGDAAASIQGLRKIAADRGVEAIYRDMALIRVAYLTVDGDDPAAVEALVRPLAVESSPWRHSAREIQALVALRQGDKARAGELFARLAEDGGAPEQMRTRAAEMVAVVGQPGRS